MDVDRTIAGIAAAQHGVLSRSQLLDAGVAARSIEHRLARGRLLRMHAGVYRIVGQPESPRQALILPVTWDDSGSRRPLMALIGRGLKENPHHEGETLQTSRRGTMAAG